MPEKTWLLWDDAVPRAPSVREHGFLQSDKSMFYEHVCLVTANSGKTVVLSLWKDQFTWGTSPLRYIAVPGPGGPNYFGRSERTDHLAHVRRECDGLFRAVIATPKDPEHS